MKEIADNIKRLRAEKGVTQQELADAVCVSFQTVSKWENDITTPDVSMLPKLSVFFGVTIDKLFELNREERYKRIEKMIDLNEEAGPEVLSQEIKYLLNQLDTNPEDEKTLILLSGLYNYSADCSRRKAGNYAKIALKVNPYGKDALSELSHSYNNFGPDWNTQNHSELISILYKHIKLNKNEVRPVYYLLDNLIADYRLDEADSVLENYEKKNEDFHWTAYHAKIEFVRGNAEKSGEYLKILRAHYTKDSSCAAYAYFLLAEAEVYRTDYECALKDFESSFSVSKPPRYMDALDAKTQIYRILKNADAEIKERRRKIDVLKSDWNITSGVMVENELNAISELIKSK